MASGQTSASPAPVDGGRPGWGAPDIDAGRMTLIYHKYGSLVSITGMGLRGYSGWVMAGAGDPRCPASTQAPPFLCMLTA